MMRHHRAVLGFWGPVFRSSSGSTLLWMIGALVVLGSVAAGVAFMSPSASRGKLEQEAAMRAFYNANAGLQFLNSVSEAAENAQINFSKFTSQMGGTGVVTYTMPDNGTFSYQLGNIQTNGVNGTYQITNLIGTVQDANDKSAYLYSIYGGGRKSDLVNYIPRASENPHTPPSDVAYIAETLNFSGDKMTGNYVFKKYIFNGGVNIEGSLDYVGTGGCLDYGGGNLGLSNGTSHFCSNTCFILEAGRTATGTIYAQTDVEIKGRVNGDIYAGGNVVINNNGTVDGSIYAVGNVAVDSGTVTKSVTSGGDVSMPTWNSRINGNVYYYGKWTPPPAAYLLGGTATKVNTKPSSPASCKSYDLPMYTYKIPTREDPKSPATYTITGSTDISDKSWVFPSFNMTKGGTSLCLDLSADNSYINIFVNGDFKFMGYLQLKTPSSGSCVNASTYSAAELESYAKRVYMEVGGSVTFSKDAHLWIGTVFAQGDIKGNSTTDVIGTLYSNGTIDLGGGSVAYTVVSDYVSKNW